MATTIVPSTPPVATGDPRQVSGVSPLGEGRNTALNTALRKRILGAWRFFQFGVLVVVVAIGVALLDTLSDHGVGPDIFWGAAVAYVVVLVLALVGAQRFVGRILLSRWRSRGLPARQVLTYTVEDDAMVIASDSGVTRVRWPYVSEVVPAGKAYCLLPAGGMFYFVPRRFFADKEAEIAFLDALLARMPEAARARSVEARKMTTFV